MSGAGVRRFVVTKVRFEGNPRREVYEEIPNPAAGPDAVGWAAPDAGHAFNEAVVKRGLFSSSQYRIFPLEGSVGIAVRVELNVTDEDGSLLTPKEAA